MLIQILQCISILLLLNAIESKQFENITHALKRSEVIQSEFVASKPFPTGAFWSNLAIQENTQAISPMPYSIKIAPNFDFQISYPFRVLTKDSITQGFQEDLIVTGGANAYKIIRFDKVSATLKFNGQEDTSYIVYLVRGSPFMTMDFKNAFITLRSYTTITLEVGENKQLRYFYKFALGNGQTWLLVASKQLNFNPLENNSGYQTDCKVTAIVRFALLSDAPAGNIAHYALSKYSNAYAIGGTVENVYDATLDDMRIVYTWTVRYMNDKDEQRELLMLTLPHHRNMMSYKMSAELKFQYFAMKGAMRPILGTNWLLVEKAEPLLWENQISEHFPSKHLEIIIESLEQDIKVIPTSVAIYSYGKQIARYARLVQIAKQLNSTRQFQQSLHTLLSALTPWLSGGSANKFVYDVTWGGIVTLDGIHDQNAEFGNGFYNDHHFHYGYFIYAIAVAAKHDPRFARMHKAAILDILGDIGTMKDNDTRFPFMRHKDMWTGHSWASGLFQMAAGKSQESSSEAVNAYYAMALLANALGDATSEHFYRAMLQMEIRSTQAYYHMKFNKGTLSNDIYEPGFVAKNRMVGVLSETEITCSTWFGKDLKFIHGIQILPVTPITKVLFQPSFVENQYPMLELSFPAGAATANDVWYSIALAEKAILDPAASWKILSQPTYTAFDDGNSKANALFWIATMSAWGLNSPIFKMRPPSAIWKDTTCLGNPGCYQTGSQGIPLSCCSTLPGCCNVFNASASLFSCCTNSDKQNAGPSFVPSPITKIEQCFGQPRCASAGAAGSPLACCGAPKGCCPGLACCIDVNMPSNKGIHRTIDPPQFSCDNECATAGPNKLPLGCCSTEKGCCPGHACCPLLNSSANPILGRNDLNTSPRVQFQVWWVAGLISILLFLASGTYLLHRRRNRQYVRIGEAVEDEAFLRTCSCMLLSVPLFALFIYLCYGN